MGRRVKSLSVRFQCNRRGKFFWLAAILFIRQMTPIQAADNTDVVQKVENPHGNIMYCSSCHTSIPADRNTLRFSNNISQLCQSCHDGLKAPREVHPVNIAPSTNILSNIPSAFPLEQGKLTCLTCHDINWQCTIKEPIKAPNSAFLRKNTQSSTLDFCFSCHIRTNYQPFNVHSQIDTGKTKTDTCLWCHLVVPDTNSLFQNSASYKLRGEASRICGNCHHTVINNPNDETHTHMYMIPSQEMRLYTSAYEISPLMSMPFEKLMEYVQASNRAPKAVPLDENGRITCWSCHNPHEKGLLPDSNPRSNGAEPDKAKNHRLRARKGDISCRMCHQK